MKTSRAWMIWSALAVCAMLVIGAMTWLTRGVLASEMERVKAEARADLEERTRLALWRMDALGASVVSGENRHPPADYLPGSSAFRTTPDPLVKLHFELREGRKLTSPEPDPSGDKLPALRNLLGANPLPGDEWALLEFAAEVSETAWDAVPKDAVQETGENKILRQQKGGIEVRRDSVYQTNFSNTELAKRARSVEETLKNSFDVESTGNYNRITNLGTMRAAWVGGEIFLLRQFTVSVADRVEKGVQGVWLDRSLLERRLVDEAKDLLPEAALAASMNGGANPLALVSFPFLLLRNESPPPFTREPNGPLLLGWAAVLLAILTAALLVRGVMRLSDRRASFVSAVTHELRTPLTTFRLYSDMLESGAVKEEKRGEYLRVLSLEADRLSHLVENVLGFSQIERGSARSVVRGMTVVELLESMRERLESRLATAGMTLRMNLDPAISETPLHLDSAAVEHILFNLIDNAAKYAADGDPPHVDIAAKAGGRAVVLLVSDHGPGIPASERRRIFRPFHKSARDAAESRPGVGLGLALSRRLARGLGGDLRCGDSPGKGAVFELHLPIAPRRLD